MSFDTLPIRAIIGIALGGLFCVSAFLFGLYCIICDKGPPQKKNVRSQPQGEKASVYQDQSFSNNPHENSTMRINQEIPRVSYAGNMFSQSEYSQNGQVEMMNSAQYPNQQNNYGYQNQMQQYPQQGPNNPDY